MRLLGPLVRLQIQTASLKRGAKPDQWYDPAALLEAESLSLDWRGASIPDPAGGAQLDVHHLDHPETKQSPGENALSVGFTGHYARMRARFGARAAAGVAGENLIVDCAEAVPLEEVRDGLVLRSAATGRSLALRNASVAHPCRPFSLFLLGGGAEPEALKAALQFLDGGTRGFYFVAEDGEPFLARLGDEVYAR
jgi:hypothetical protein